MNKKLVSLLAIVTLTLAILVLPACSNPAPAPAPAPAPTTSAPAPTTAAPVPMPKPATLSIMSAAPGGSWYPIAVAMGELWQKNIPGVGVTQLPGGGVANVQGVDAAKAQVGISMGCSIGDGLVGNAPFTAKTTKTTALISLYTQYLPIMTWEDSSIKTLADLKGKRLVPGAKGWTIESIVQRMLAAAGLSYADMSKVDYVTGPEGAKLIKDGHTDAFADGVDKPSDPEIVEMTLFKGIRFLPVSDAELAKIQAIGPGIYREIMPKGAYKGVNEDIPLISSNLGVIVNADLPEDLVYHMTRVLVENWVGSMQPVMAALKNVQPQELAKPLGVDFHPGALKYFKEKGWIK